MLENEKNAKYRSRYAFSKKSFTTCYANNHQYDAVFVLVVIVILFITSSFTFVQIRVIRKIITIIMLVICN